MEIKFDPILSELREKDGSTGGAGTVTTVSVVSANGVTGTVANPTSTPAITLDVSSAISGKQDLLVSGTNIKTINSTSILGSGDIVLDGGTSNIGYLNIPQNSKSANYTTILSDAGKHIFHPVADANSRTFTIDSNANVPYPIGTTLMFVNDVSANTCLIHITDDTMYMVSDSSTGERQLGGPGIATALKVTATSWLISGINLV